MALAQCKGVGCRQGRKICPHPSYCNPAEAATELGADDDEEPPPWFLGSDFFVAAILIILACFLAGLAYGALTR